MLGGRHRYGSISLHELGSQLVLLLLRYCTVIKNIRQKETILRSTRACSVEFIKIVCHRMDYHEPIQSHCNLRYCVIIIPNN